MQLQILLTFEGVGSNPELKIANHLKCIKTNKNWVSCSGEHEI